MVVHPVTHSLRDNVVGHHRQRLLKPDVDFPAGRVQLDLDNIRGRIKVGQKFRSENPMLRLGG